MKEAVLLLAHGSRREEGNTQVEKILEQVKKRDPKERLYEICFLEFARPTLAEGVEKMAAAGAEVIIVVPLFLVAGNHVRKHIPDLLRQQREKHPEINFILTGHLGAHSNLANVIIDLIEDGSKN
ncbi:sirohydrochlorin ferrochelatase [Desulfohalotomaculum tongense]|uniref:sirohydrochlorin chelatase n=1 Tax=Desulforadius tongensis TaxID=1216062 RepID=UPI00195AFF21|nr:CbiX/SirB N-terminal domain-containing protein [Desulforadius tongensis]MBM7854338.1 sirohydrochlorin ferrochelatase [Desulforadius tongensis]